MRVIFVPQYPTYLRYQDWWFRSFPREFKKYFDEVIVLGPNVEELVRGDKQMFSPIEKAIQFELRQIEEYMKLELKEDDVLFVADLSFPGFFINSLYHKKPKRCYAFCHATSINYYDYFEPVRDSKFLNECAYANLFDKVFVGSNYHKEKLGWRNTIVTRLPKPPFSFFEEIKSFGKYDSIISVSRPTPQKVDKKLEEKVIARFGQIIRYEPKTWKDYYAFVAGAKILLVTAKEETFGYQVMDAIMSGTIPLCPNKLAYKELLPRTYLYNSFPELLKKLTKFLHQDEYKVPEILCQNEIDNFYETICEIMKGE